MNKTKVGIIGASGYAGAELLRLLLNHSQVDVVGIYSRSYKDQKISDLYPGFYEVTDLIFEDEDTLIRKSDIVFASLPHGVSEVFARKCIDQDKKFIDLGADFRLDDEDDYKEWYQLDYNEPALHQKSVYGLSELYHDDIKQAQIIGNPGCYPTAVSLGLYPLIKQQLLTDQHLIIDAKSGATGAGKELSETTHFTKLNESFGPYKVAQHRHTPEIEQTLSNLAKQKIQISFVPHLLPINRGIIATMYIPLNENISIEELHQQYCQAYQEHLFVRVLPLGKTSNLKYVQYSNYCDISLHFDERNNMLIVVSAIDNMIKGAAGQAIQNMNIICNFKEDEGLKYIPPSF